MIKKISVIFPTFNESENLPILYKNLNKELGTRDIDFEVIIIDDNSPDGTWEVAKKLEKESQKVKAIIFNLKNTDLFNKLVSKSSKLILLKYSLILANGQFSEKRSLQTRK